MIAVLPTVYPAALPFIDDFLDGIENQIDSDFVLLIVNDGIEAFDQLTSGKSFEIHVLEASGTPAALRRQGIDWAEQKGAEWIIFADADDVCAAERVAKTRTSRDGADVLFNDLIMFGEQTINETSLLSSHFEDGDAARPGALVNMNFLGMSNTVAKAGLLNRSAAYIPDDLTAFDWALFTRMVLNGAVVRFMGGAPTRYRQYGGNVAGPGDSSNKQILWGVSVKARHYDVFRPDGEPYRQLADKFAALRMRLDTDEAFLHDYCNAVRENSPECPLWWEPMKLPEELGL